MDAFLLCLPHLLFRWISMSSPSPSPSPLRKDLQLLLPLLITTTTTTTATITTIFNHQITTRANRPGVVEECLAIASLLTGVTTWVTTQVCIIIMFFITTIAITWVRPVSPQHLPQHCFQISVHPGYQGLVSIVFFWFWDRDLSILQKIFSFGAKQVERADCFFFRNRLLTNWHVDSFFVKLRMHFRHKAHTGHMKSGFHP